MKCPHCGHWNRPTFPRCFQCGTPLGAAGEKQPAWRGQFVQPQRKARRVVYDDTMEPVEDLVQPMTEEERAEQASLAEEMARLRDRRTRGEAYLKTFQQATQEKEALEPPAVSIRRGGFFDEPPEEAPQAPEETTQRIRRRRAPRGEASRSYPPPEDAYEAQADDDLPPEFDAPGYIAPPAKKRPSRRVRGPIVLAYCLVGLLVVGAAGFGVYALASQVIPNLLAQGASTEKLESVFIEPSTLNGLPAHRILIAGEEGSQIYIAELMKTYVVVNGLATIEVADHVFYDAIDPLEIATMEVSLTPTLLGTGRDIRLESIRYTIDIPQTEIVVVRPEAKEISVNTATYNMSLQVPPGSKVYINGEEKSDTVDEDGMLNYSAPIAAIGDNVITILARAPYCRANSDQVTIYRAPMEIPLELDAATLSYVSTDDLTIRATTEVDATITVESPVYWVNTDKLGVDGTFIISAKMTRVGNNTVTIRASYPGKADSVVEHVVYYLPPPETYTPKAWALGAQDYSELMNNIAMRIERAQIYLCRGTVTRELSQNPQLVIMNTGTDGREQLVLLENGTRDGTVWEIGKVYRVYADVSGVYNNMPRMMGRYSYIVEEETQQAQDDPDDSTEPAEPTA